VGVSIGSNWCRFPICCQTHWPMCTVHRVRTDQCGILQLCYRRERHTRYSTTVPRVSTQYSSTQVRVLRSELNIRGENDDSRVKNNCPGLGFVTFSHTGHFSQKWLRTAEGELVAGPIKKSRTKAWVGQLLEYSSTVLEYSSTRVLYSVLYSVQYE
jgi:hypothetical protein